MRREGLPVVLVDVTHPALPRVVIDDVRGGEMATEYLLAKGHRRIGFVGDAPTPFGFAASELRCHGMRAALRARRHPAGGRAPEAGPARARGGDRAGADAAGDGEAADGDIRRVRRSGHGRPASRRGARFARARRPGGDRLRRRGGGGGARADDRAPAAAGDRRSRGRAAAVGDRGRARSPRSRSSRRWRWSSAEPRNPAAPRADAIRASTMPERRWALPIGHGRNRCGVDERELTARVEALTTEQKVRLLTGADFWSLHEEPAVGLRRARRLRRAGGRARRALGRARHLDQRAVADRAGGDLGRAAGRRNSGDCWPPRRAASASTCCSLRP